MMSGHSDIQAPGSWLRRQREAIGLTQEELARDSGLSVRAISNLERDRTRRPQAHSLRSIGLTLGLSEAAVRDLIVRYRVGLDPASRQTVDGAGDGRELGAPAGLSDQPGRGSTVVPRQLPAATATFTGRAAELALLDEWLEGALRDSDRVVVISAIGGMAGVGKTALALHWAHRVAGRFPDGQLYADLRGYGPAGEPAASAEVVRGFLHSLGVAPEVIPATADGLTALYRSVLANRRMLIVADNARSAAQVRPLLPGMPGSVVLVTSRSQLSGLAAADGARMLNLDVLTEPDAAGLLAARLGTERVGAEPEAVAELIRLCGRLPLALAVVTARAAMSGWSLTALARQLASAEDRLGELGLDDPVADVRAVFSWSVRQLSDEAARMFWLLAVHPGPDISVAAAISIARLSAPHATALLRELAASSLVVERVPGRYLMHDLLRAYATGQVEASPRHADALRQATARAVFDHYARAARHAAHVLDPEQPAPPDQQEHGVTGEQIVRSDQALAWFDTERKVLLAVISQASSAGADGRACELATAFEPFCIRRSNWADLALTQQVALDCSTRLADGAGQARAHLNLGRALASLGQREAAGAHVSLAVELAHALGDRATEALAHLAFSNIWPDLADMIASCERALFLAEEDGNTALMARACNNLGYGYALAGDAERALEHCQRALDLCRQAATDPVLEGHIYDSLGRAYLGCGDQRQAVASYARAVRRFRAIGALHLSAESLVSLGDCYAAAGNAAPAIDAWQQALVILDDLSHPEAGETRAKLREHARVAANGSRPAS